MLPLNGVSVLLICSPRIMELTWNSLFILWIIESHCTGIIWHHNQFGTHSFLVQAVILVSITARFVLGGEPPPVATLRTSRFHAVSERLPLNTPHLKENAYSDYYYCLFSIYHTKQNSSVNMWRTRYIKACKIIILFGCFIPTENI